MWNILLDTNEVEKYRTEVSKQQGIGIKEELISETDKPPLTFAAKAWKINNSFVVTIPKSIPIIARGDMLELTINRIERKPKEVLP